MKVSKSLVQQLLNPFYQAQHIIAHMLRLDTRQISQLTAEQEGDLLNELVTEPTSRLRVNGARTIRLLGLWASSMGFKPWLMQPYAQYRVMMATYPPSWAQYLSEAITHFECSGSQGAWAIFEVTTKNNGIPVLVQETRYVLVQVVDALHQQASDTYSNSPLRLAA